VVVYEKGIGNFSSTFPAPALPDVPVESRPSFAQTRRFLCCTGPSARREDEAILHEEVNQRPGGAPQPCGGEREYREQRDGEDRLVEQRRAEVRSVEGDPLAAQRLGAAGGCLSALPDGGRAQQEVQLSGNTIGDGIRHERIPAMRGPEAEQRDLDNARGEARAGEAGEAERPGKGHGGGNAGMRDDFHNAHCLSQ
jgi:hypothetical protein